MDTADIVIGGGGIIGLSAALELARNGFRVTLLERGRAMAEASWAAAGMLAAEDPENPVELAELAAFSRRLYPEYLSTIERLSEHPVPLRTWTTLQGTQPAGSFHGKDTATRFAITAKEAEKRVAGLAPGSRSFLWLEEASLDPRDLCTALPAAAIAAGVVLREETEVIAVEGQPGSVPGLVQVSSSGGTISAGSFVNCCGAWATTVECSAQASFYPTDLVEPRKGQMITVRLQGPRQLQTVLRTPEIYLVPRGDGRIVIGATVERVGFDRRIEPPAVEALLAKAADLWPAIASCPVVESWSGLRPGTSNGLPLIGRSGTTGCWMATGHFRNGILLAPATAVVLRQLIEGRTPGVALDAFAPERFDPKRFDQEGFDRSSHGANVVR